MKFNRDKYVTFHSEIKKTMYMCMCMYDRSEIKNEGSFRMSHL